MRAFRCRIVALTLGWLACQAAGFAAVPAVACQMCLHQGDEVPACCRNMKPGQMCPMHAHDHDDSEQASHMNGSCSCHDVSLLALAAGLAAPPATPATAVMDVSVPEAVAIAPGLTIARVVPPEAPPPRS